MVAGFPFFWKLEKSNKTTIIHVCSKHIKIYYKKYFNKVAEMEKKLKIYRYLTLDYFLNAYLNRCTQYIFGIMDDMRTWVCCYHRRSVTSDVWYMRRKYQTNPLYPESCLVFLNFFFLHQSNVYILGKFKGKIK